MAGSPVPSHIWVGPSVEDQRRADERLPWLCATPAAVRFLSCEPLLGQVSLEPWVGAARPVRDVKEVDGSRGDRGPIDWVIVAGESGARHRWMGHEWARRIRDECLGAGVSFFYKQGSGPRTEMDRWLDGALWEQYPAEEPTLVPGSRYERIGRRPDRRIREPVGDVAGRAIYAGREATWVKHEFLSRYLETLAYKVGWS